METPYKDLKGLKTNTTGTSKVPSIPVDKNVITCDHLYGYWQDGEDCIVYDDKETWESNHTCNDDGYWDETVTKFNYCPLCGVQI